ncbi:MAG: prepilin-type cleavage/methylation domain-containing protein [Myxococcales bacterium]|nr:prepilin-type cleavage/methylation domain-containing protein [Myxococcales bacterium]
MHGEGAGARRRAARLGVTLVEVLIVVALAAVVTGIGVMGFGGVSSARLKRASTQISGAVRVAYAHATATSKVTRLVFDFEEGKILLEEAEGTHLVRRDQSGGAEASTEIEEQAIAAAGIAEGPRAPRASFSTVKALGFPAEGKELPAGIQFWRIDTDHQEQPIGEGRAYLYFFPGGQTETAAIQIRVSNADEADTSSYMTVLVAPLTGKAQIHKGRIEMPRPRDEQEASEREDVGG